MKNDIIRILQQNARISDRELGVMLGISEEEASAEIKKLEDEGVIKGYSVILNEELYDKSAVYATIELKVTPQRDCGFDDIAKTIMMYDEVDSIWLMSGAYDLAVKVKGDNLRDVALFVSERLSTIEGVLSTATHFMLKTYKEKGIFIDNEDIDERGMICP
ncbi:MAG: Lrp/AsnC family transcriptional regulator [Ruminococcus sp.]|nr:Lrp/AsnC family transcriptional regulator [Ruminococcus sp.]MBQ9956405.1 Lrp/AsnC family transcriptional regulator [Ruminococcus sp.]MBR6791558.1 Lrp/AsnC family transcriptional regulator [Ruminococcus sp.]